MARVRIRYFVLISLIIILGLLSRKFGMIPLWVGDVLWATMIYFIVRFFIPKASVLKIILISIIICYLIELASYIKRGG